MGQKLDDLLKTLTAAVPATIYDTIPELQFRYLGAQGYLQGTLAERIAASMNAPPGPPPLTGIFVNSVSGSDSNDGSEASPMQTLAAATALVTPGTNLWMARGSYWREMVSPTVNMTIGTYGTGAVPVIDLAEVATGWTPAAGLTNVWELTWTRPGPITGNDWLGLWVDGVRPRQADSNIDLRDGAPGAWYVDGGNYFANPAVVRIQSATDPNLGGKVYEITRFNSAVRWHTAVGGSGVTVTLNGPLESKRASNHYNALAGGPGVIKNQLIRDGHIHHIVTDGTLTENVIATEIRDRLTIPGIPFTAYRDIGTGFEHDFVNCMALFPGGASRTIDAQGFYAHGGSVPIVQRVGLTGCVTKGMNGLGVAATTASITGHYVEDPWEFGIDLNGFTTNLSASLVYETAASPKAGGSTGIRHENAQGVMTLSNVGVVSRGGAAFTGKTLVGGGSLAVSNSVLISLGSSGVSGGSGSYNYCVIDGANRAFNAMDVGLSGDHNVFFSQNGESEPWFFYNGSLYAYNSLVNFIAASGTNQNSVYTKPVDQGSGNPNAFWLGVSTGTNAGPLDGDFRVNPAAKVYTTGGDAVPPHESRIGTFLDDIPLTTVGIQQKWDYNGTVLVPGAPTARPILPSTIAEMRTVVNERTDWTF